MGSFSIITICKTENPPVYSRINLQARYEGLIQTQFKIFFYIDDSPSNHTWKKKIEGYQCEKTLYIYIYIYIYKRTMSFEELKKKKEKYLYENNTLTWRSLNLVPEEINKDS